jgi:tetratricopeptide (TPR) repeat protein
MAVELAAARLDDLSAAGIRQSLTDRFAVLVRRRGHAPQRQETLASLFAWSCDLLDPFERAALAELSVFAGTFTEAAATAVVSETPRAAELLEALVNKSLVFREESGRLRLPNSLVEFVKNELDGESRRAIELRHVQYYRDVARDANARYRTIPVRDWIATLAADDDNLRIGLARAWGGDFETVVAGAELAGELRRYFELRGHIREGIEWCDRFLSALPLNRPDEVAALLYVERARLLEVVGSIESALPSAREGVELYRRGNNPRRLAYALNQLANAEMFCQHIGDAEEHFREALRIESKLKDPLGRASVLAHLGNIALYFRLDLDRAEDYFKEAHAIFSEHGHELNVAWSLGSLAEVAYRRGDVQTALFFSEKSLAQYRAIGEHPNLPSELERYARVMIDLDRLDEAKAPLAEALRRFRDAGHEAGIVEVVGDYALLAAKRGSWTTAARLFGKVRRAADTFVHGRFDDWKRIELLIVKNLGEETFAAEASLGAQAPLDELLATMEESTLPL